MESNWADQASGEVTHLLMELDWAVVKAWLHGELGGRAAAP
jgi:hypothetical protein